MEKPVQRYFINAGIYVLEPEVLSQLPTGEVFDMTTLIDRAEHRSLTSESSI